MKRGIWPNLWVGIVGWGGWLAKLPSHLAPISRTKFFCCSHFLPRDRTVNPIAEVGGADARFFTTNLVKDTKIRQLWSPESILLRLVGAIVVMGSEGVGDTCIVD